MNKEDPYYEINERIDDLVDEWHNSPRIKSGLQEFLGMNDKQYRSWVREPSKFYASSLGQSYIEDILGKE